MVAVEQYLKPEIASQIKRLDIRAQMIVRGFLQGLHASPFQGFSVEFSEHRRYAAGDDPKYIDWLVYAKTDRYYIKKFEAETNLTAYLLIDTSGSMNYTYRQQLTKFDYCVCLAAALSFLMISQQDPVGLMTFDDKLKARVAPRSRRSQLPNILSQLTNLTASGSSNLPAAVEQLAVMLKHNSLILLMSDLLGGEAEETLSALRRLRANGHDVIVFHVLDEAEVSFPFTGNVEFIEPESDSRMAVHADELVQDYRERIEAFRAELSAGCARWRIDYVPLDSSMAYDVALIEYLRGRQGRF